MAPLRRDGLVKSVRGAQAAISCRVHPAEITIGQVLRTLEGDLAIIECLTEDEFLRSGRRLPHPQGVEAGAGRTEFHCGWHHASDMLEPNAGTLKGSLQ
jgi:DNA-binding IscR family transcriptional regulator